MRSYQGRKCLCCKNCTKCQEFRKVISDNGFDIYIYVKHAKAMTKGNDVVCSNGFVFNNMHNIAINKNDILQKIESSEFNCQRCKSVLIQVSNSLKEPIQENKIVVICASCISRCMSGGLQRCKFCHRIYDRFISNKKLQDVTTQDCANKWSSEIRHLLADERYEQIDTKLIPSDTETQHIKNVVSHPPQISAENDVEAKHEQLDKKLMPSDKEPQDKKTIGAHLPPMTTEKEVDLNHGQIDVELMTLDVESQNLKTIVSHLPRVTTEKDVDVKYLNYIKKLNLELKSGTQDIKNVSYLSQETKQDKITSEQIIEILQKSISQEAFDYVFPKIDFKQANLREHISSSELLKEIEEKVDKDKNYSAKKETKSETIDSKKVKMKKETLSSKHVHIDEEQVKFPSRTESQTVNEGLKRKDEKEVDVSEKIKFKPVDLHVDDNDEPEIQIKRKEKLKAPDAHIDKIDVLEIKVKRKEKYKAVEANIYDKDLTEIKVKRKEKHKAADADMDDKELLQIKVKRKEKYKAVDADIYDKDLTEIKVKSKDKNKAADAPEIKVKKKEKAHKDLGIDKREKDAHDIEQIKSTEERVDSFDFSKIVSKKSNKGEKEDLLSNRKKKTKKGSKSSMSDSMQIITKKDKDQSEVLKESDEPVKTSKKEKKSNREKNIRSAPTEDIKLSKVKLRDTSIDDFHIDMVKIKQSTFAREKDRPEKKKKQTEPVDLKAISLIDQELKQKRNKISSTVVYKDLEIINENEIDELLRKIKLKEINEIIIGKKIIKHRKRYLDKIANKNIQPMLFESTFKHLNTEEAVKGESYQPEEIITPVRYRKSKSLHKFTDQDASKGGIHYKLSHRSFIDKGWTMLPTEKIVRKMNIYRMRPSHPEFDWFEHNKDKRLMYYDTGETLAEFDEDGRGRWFYKNGRLALDYYNAEEVNAGQRYVVYSNGEPDEQGRPRPITVLATFDYLGNGIVFDHTGQVRLKYNQTEGAVLDKDIGPVSHWKWHELNDPPILQKVMIDTQMAIKDPDILKMGGTGENIPRADNEEMLAIEFDNFIKEKSKKLSQKFKPFQIKMKALKINENFSLRVLDQATVYLLFRDGPTNLKLNLGMILDHKQIVDTDTAEVGEVTCNLERLPARTDSLAMLQRSVAHAQHVEKLRIERERRFKISNFKPSIDRLTAAVSRPLKPPVLTEPEIECLCSTRK